MKITIQLEVDDGLEPCTYGCEMYCPLGYLDDDGDYSCINMYRVEGNITCIVKEAMEKKNKDE